MNKGLEIKRVVGIQGRRTKIEILPPSQNLVNRIIPATIANTIGSAILRRLREDSFTNPKYIEMVREKFGSKVVEHIEQMLKHKIHRRFI